MKYYTFLFACLLLLFSSCSQESGTIWIPKIFGDGMILQRNAAIPIFGRAKPHGKLRIDFGGLSYSCTADSEGKWRVDIGPFDAGGPYELKVIGSNVLVFSDIYLGEVWLCGGQSNMQYTLDMLQIDETKYVGRSFLPFRFFNVEIDWDVAVSRVVKGGEWQQVHSGNVGTLSALAYYFGRTLQDSLTIPVGLISSSLGATSIETWMSANALRAFPQFEEILQMDMFDSIPKEDMLRSLEQFRMTWDTSHYLKGIGIEERWYLPEIDVTGWDSVQFPILWQDNILPGHHGAVWFRKEVDEWPTFFGDQPYIALNQIDDYDVVWVNGHKIGEGFGSRTWRRYDVPTAYLKDSNNVIVVRVFDIGGKGGFYTNPFWGNDILNGTWQYKAGIKIDTSTFPKPMLANASMFTHPSVLYNANIAPLAPYGIRGVIWYQGEANEDRGVEYANLLPALIDDWRKNWNHDSLPFLIVQLANYREENLFSEKSKWAQIREAQFVTAREDKHVGIATAVDIGDANDIHPTNKEDLGVRLAGVALRDIHNKTDIPISPVYDDSEVINDTVFISLNTFGQTLEIRRTATKFQIAGYDRIFYPAEFLIKNEKLLVFSPKVKEPIAVRYAWADNPGSLNIYSKTGLPLIPFRTDQWDLPSKGKVFQYEPWGF